MNSELYRSTVWGRKRTVSYIGQSCGGGSGQ